MTAVPSPEPDPDWCHDAVRGVSRTFGLIVDVFEDLMASHVYLRNLLCRIADTVENVDLLPSGERVTLLET